MKNSRVKDNRAKKCLANHKATLLTTAIASILVPNMSANATDLEIYSPETDGRATLMLMLDTSGSMEAFDDGSCPSPYTYVSVIDEDGDIVTTTPRHWDGSKYTTYAVNNTKFYTTVKKDDGTDGDKIPINKRGCNLHNTSTDREDRLTKLKTGLIDVFSDPKTEIDESYLATKKIGLGTFFTGYNGAQTGKLTFPAIELNYNNRIKMIKSIASMDANGSTPSANAYPEAGAYMLGTSTFRSTPDPLEDDPAFYTLGRIEKETYTISGQTYSYYNLQECVSNSGTPTPTDVRDFNSSSADVKDVRYCNNGFFKTSVSTAKRSRNYTLSQQKQYIDNNTIEAKTGIDLSSFSSDYLGSFESSGYIYFYGQKKFPKTVWDGVGWNYLSSSNYSGFLKSPKNSKVSDGSKYKSPVLSDSICDGYGIYFLSDGEPNSTSDTIAKNLMSASLEKPSSEISCDSNTAGINPNGVAYPTGNGWNCMGAYSKKLRDKTNTKKVEIKTATVGFGSDFDSLEGKSSIEKILQADGITYEDKEVYDCSQGSTQDVRNLCYLGNWTSDYGEGGFTYAKTAGDITSSITKFLAVLQNGDTTRISAGVMSVPIDKLNTQKSRGVAYLPMIEPNPGSNLLWNGNLKKYNVQKGTLVGENSTQATMKQVFKGDTGVFSKDTYDFWKEANSVDEGNILAGGSFEQILNTLDADTTPKATRNLFVNNSVITTNSSVTTVDYALKPVSVKGTAGDYKPDGFDGLTLTSSQTGGIIDSNKNTIAKRQLLSFMGFSKFGSTLIPTNGTKLPTATVLDNVNNKKLGGVLHSVPQLVTTSIDFDSNSGQFNNSTRKDYLIYGSMDGALHMLDDSTGKETFTFVPKEILDVQAEAITGGQAESGRPYGVDGPWNIYASYKFSSNKYQAQQVIAMGGLRMGGSTYYALDISDVKNPTMIYTVGSNYANKLIDSTTTLASNKNGVVTPSNTAYARMGQSWAKPSTGFVMKGGKKVMVNFLAGGYDMGYEKTDFKPTETVGTPTVPETGPAQGNAVYMVEVGKVNTTAVSATDSTIASEKIDYANSGDLLWWTSSDVNATTVKNEMFHSIVTEVRTLDGNGDGLTDHIYFADLGGRVWRADIATTAEKDDDGNLVLPDFRVDRVEKLLDISDREDSTYGVPRFYERPVITFDRFKLKSYNSGLINAVITVGTGNRSRPVTDKRSANDSDAIYTFLDKDIARDKKFCYEFSDPKVSCANPAITNGISTGLLTKTSTISDLVEMTHTAADANIKTNILNETKSGWYMPLNYWHVKGSTTAPDKDKAGIKLLSQPDAIGGFLYVSRYNPVNGNTAVNSCSAGIIGSTQVERLCLPYGNCANNFELPANAAPGTTKNWGAYVVKETGLGIVDNILTQVNPQQAGSSLLGILDTYCEGPDCNSQVLCPEGDTSPGCKGFDEEDFLDINNDQVLNPLEWMEE